MTSVLPRHALRSVKSLVIYDRVEIKMVEKRGSYVFRKNSFVGFECSVWCSLVFMALLRCVDVQIVGESY